MAVFTLSQQAGEAQHFGLSTDTKPAATAGHTFLATDTGQLFTANGSAWVAALAHVAVASLSDLPTPAGDVITLADNTAYQIIGNVNIGANRIVCGIANIISGIDRTNDKITSTTTGALFTCDSSSVVKTIFTVQNITCTATSGTLLDFTSTSANQSAVFISCTLTGFVSFGVINFCSSFISRNTLWSTASVGGFTITNAGTQFVFRDSVLVGVAGTAFDFGTSVWSTILIGGNRITTAAAQTFLSGTTGGANVTVAGKLTGNIFSGAGTYVSTITSSDALWYFDSNAGVADTPSGGGGGDPAFTAFTQDLGVSHRSGTFDITGLSGLTTDKPVLIMQTAAPITSKGDARDEPEMDQIQATGYVLNATTIRVFWNCRSVVVGSYNFAYLVGA